MSTPSQKMPMTNHDPSQDVDARIDYWIDRSTDPRVARLLQDVKQRTEQEKTCFMEMYTRNR
jgi:hypothetical protein